VAFAPVETLEDSDDVIHPLDAGYERLDIDAAPAEELVRLADVGRGEMEGSEQSDLAVVDLPRIELGDRTRR